MKDDDLEGLLSVERRAEGAPAGAEARVWDRVEHTLGIAAGAAGAGTAASSGGSTVASASGAGVAAGIGAKATIVAVSIVALGTVAALQMRDPDPTPARPRAHPAARAAEPSDAIDPPRAAVAPAPPRTAQPDPAPAAPVRVATVRPERDLDLEAERTALVAARTAISGGDGSAALAALGDHARRFPRGRLAEEREGLVVRALVLAGRTDEARAAAERFRASHPGSLYQGVVDAAIESIP